MLPHAIDEHACCERVASTGNGIGEFQPATSITKFRPIAARKNFKKTPRHHIARGLRLSAHKNGIVRRPRGVDQNRSSCRSTRFDKFEKFTGFQKLPVLISGAAFL